jgi:hypothetical protein
MLGAQALARSKHEKVNKEENSVCRDLFCVCVCVVCVLFPFLAFFFFPFFSFLLYLCRTQWWCVLVSGVVCKTKRK